MMKKLLVPEVDLVDGIMQTDVEDISVSQHRIEGQLHQKSRFTNTRMSQNGTEATFLNYIVCLGTHPSEGVAENQVFLEHGHIPVL
jgi:hypothetical protein